MQANWPEWLTQFISPEQLEQSLPAMQIGGRIAVIVLLAWVMRSLVRRVLGKVGERISLQTDDPGSTRRSQTLVRVLSYLLSVIVVVVTVLLILGEFGVSVAPLLGAAGVAGIAIGFGAQSLVKDFFTGFFLLLEDQIRTGDVVKVAGYSGSVEEVNLRYIRLRDYEGTVHYIPNGLITGVSNSSRGFSYAVMELGISYDSNIDRAIEVITQTAAQMRAETNWLASLIEDMEIAGVERLGDSAVTIKCRFKTRALDQWKVRREFLKRIKQAFDANDIEIPFPHLKVISQTTADGDKNNPA
ncbi:MAG: mechanosensitive ion channel family protein [Burkholderiaceae bacterium]